MRVWTRRRMVAVAVAAFTLIGLMPSAGADEVAASAVDTDLTADEFLDAFDDAELDGLAPIGPAPVITGNPDVDERIRRIGENRGYRRRPGPARPLVRVDGRLLQPEAAAAWESLQQAAADAGHALTLMSAYRSEVTQAAIFRGKLAGTSDAAINRRLETVAVPGYSKHHTGYAIDIRASGVGGFAIRDTAGYRWLAADNFANAKAHGWVPSYPEGSRPAGPVPEPWEFVWIGAVNIVCADFEISDSAPFCDTIDSSFARDIDWLHDQGITTGCRPTRFCPRAEISRAEAATMLWRHAGEPEATAAIGFVDVAPDRFYTDAVRWMVEGELTTGTTPRTFTPDRSLSRSEFVTFLWRIAGRPPPSDAPPDFADVARDGFAGDAVAWAREVGVTLGTSPTTFAPDRPVTRGETAAFIRRFADQPTPYVD